MPQFSSIKDKLFRKASQSSEKSPASARGSPYGNVSGGSNSKTAHQTQDGNHTDGSSAPAAAMDDAPPAYTATAQPAAPQPVARTTGLSSDDDLYANLSSFDTVLLIDDSGSMAGNLWAEAEAALEAIAEIVTRYDEDGIDLFFLNHNSRQPPPGDKKYMAKGGYYGVDNRSVVANIFGSVRPQGCTPTGMRLEQILTPYVRYLSSAGDLSDVKPLNLIVITDGAPTDHPAQAIVAAAKALDRLFAPSYQIGIQFVQIGTCRQATEALRQLDDDLDRTGIRDIVDTVPCSRARDGSNRMMKLNDTFMLKTVLGAVNKRLDNMQVNNNRR